MNIIFLDLDIQTRVAFC